MNMIATKIVNGMGMILKDNPVVRTMILMNQEVGDLLWIDMGSIPNTTLMTAKESGALMGTCRVVIRMICQ